MNTLSPATRLRYQVTSLGTEHHVTDVWTGRITREHGAPLSTRDLAEAQQWATRLNENWGPCLESHAERS
jgi:predicted nucleic acid-binding protein